MLVVTSDSDAVVRVSLRDNKGEARRPPLHNDSHPRRFVVIIHQRCYVCAAGGRTRSVSGVWAVDAYRRELAPDSFYHNTTTRPGKSGD